jgi:glycosyltransferase involved in cell wall biosynthesis
LTERNVINTKIPGVTGMKLVHVISGLNTGGAEMVLHNEISLTGHIRHTVISLTDIGPVGKKIESLGARILALNMNRQRPNPLKILKLVKWLRQISPDVIHTWMYHADLIGSLAAKMAGAFPVVWGIHHSTLDRKYNKMSTICTMKTCARLSHSLPVKILCCSETARRIHAESGYDDEKMVVIPNGFDLANFRPDPTAREEIRLELGISDKTPLIGLVGRFDPQKDHQNFIHAADVLHGRVQEAHFLMCGDNVTSDNTLLAGWVKDAGIEKCCHLLGRRDDIPKVAASLDIATSSSSFGEAFPLVVGEAMACEVPCVVTDVGDAAYIVGETGKVVPPKNPHALAHAWQELIQLGAEGRRQLGAAARKRIEDNFSLPAIVARHESLYNELADLNKRKR